LYILKKVRTPTFKITAGNLVVKLEKIKFGLPMYFILDSKHFNKSQGKKIIV